MKTLFKSLTLAIALSLAVCVGVFAAACGDKDNNKEQGEQYSVYVVYSDGTAVNGHTDGTGYDMATDTETSIFVQWCSGERCSTPVRLGTDGKASISASKLEDALGGKPDHITLLSVKGYTENPTKEISGAGEAKITLGAKA